MIQIVQYRTVLDGKDGEKIRDAIEQKLNRLVGLRKPLLGAQVWTAGDSLWLSMRLEANDRWRISREARKTMSFLLASHRLPIPGGPEVVQTPPTARSMTADQGRVPRSRRT